MWHAAAVVIDEVRASRMLTNVVSCWQKSQLSALSMSGLVGPCACRLPSELGALKLPLKKLRPETYNDQPIPKYGCVYYYSSCNDGSGAKVDIILNFDIRSMGGFVR